MKGFDGGIFNVLSGAHALQAKQRGKKQEIEKVKQEKERALKALGESILIKQEKVNRLIEQQFSMG